MKIFFIPYLVFTLLMGSTSYALSNENLDGSIASDYSGPRLYLGIGADNLSTRAGFDSSVYGLVEGASEIFYDPLGLRFRLGADLSEVGIWAGAGISAEYVFEEDPFYIEASILAGAYSDFGNLDLDHAIQFRSQVAIGYHFENNYDVAIGYSHKSNAGLGSDNPGSESIYIRIGRGF